LGLSFGLLWCCWIGSIWTGRWLTHFVKSDQGCHGQRPRPTKRRRRRNASDLHFTC
jgi:hypothetical protein